MTTSIASLRKVPGLTLHLCLMQQVTLQAPWPFYVGSVAAKPAADGFRLVASTSPSRKHLLREFRRP